MSCAGAIYTSINDGSPAVAFAGLACGALYHGSRLASEAKAHVKECTDGGRGHGSDNADNRKRIAGAIQEASDELSRHAPGVKISSDSWFSNRIAFACKLASHGLPTALIYLGFLDDKGISSEPIQDHDHWRETVLNSTWEIFPASLWERTIDINGTPLWFLIRSLPYARQSMFGCWPSR